MEINIYSHKCLVVERGVIVTIPTMNSNYLPTGIHSCTIEEIKQSFGTNDRRNSLIDNLCEYIQNVKDFGLDGHIVIDGSFVTTKEHPGDIDIVLEVGDSYDLEAPLTISETKILSRTYVKDNFELHLFVAPDENTAQDLRSFFSRIKGNKRTKKGLLRIAI